MNLSDESAAVAPASGFVTNVGGPRRQLLGDMQGIENGKRSEVAREPGELLLDRKGEGRHAAICGQCVPIPWSRGTVIVRAMISSNTRLRQNDT